MKREISAGWQIPENVPEDLRQEIARTVTAFFAGDPEVISLVGRNKDLNEMVGLRTAKDLLEASGEMTELDWSMIVIASQAFDGRQIEPDVTKYC